MTMTRCFTDSVRLLPPASARFRLLLPPASACFRPLPPASAYFRLLPPLLPPAASFRLLPPASACFRLLPPASACCFRLLPLGPHTTCLLRSQDPSAVGGQSPRRAFNVRGSRAWTARKIAKSQRPTHHVGTRTLRRLSKAAHTTAPSPSCARHLRRQEESSRCFLVFGVFVDCNNLALVADYDARAHPRALTAAVTHARHAT